MWVFRERFRRARWFYPRVLRFLVEFRVGGCWFRVDLVSGWSPLIGQVFFGFGFWVRAGFSNEFVVLVGGFVALLG